MIDNLPAHKAAGIREAIEARRRYASLSAPVLARPQSHRDAVQQAEGVSAQGGRNGRFLACAAALPGFALHPSRPRSLQLFSGTQVISEFDRNLL